MYFYRAKIPVSHWCGWEWGWVAGTPGSILSYVIRDVDMPALASSSSPITTQSMEPSG